jgi:hypothetical protein
MHDLKMVSRHAGQISSPTHESRRRLHLLRLHSKHVTMQTLSRWQVWHL